MLKGPNTMPLTKAPGESGTSTSTVRVEVLAYDHTAREWDAETGMYYYRARYYAPNVKRFTSEDPIRFASGDTNWYRYVGNDPINFTDPLGLFPNAYPDPSETYPHNPDTSFCTQDAYCDYIYAVDKGICLTNQITQSWSCSQQSPCERKVRRRFKSCMKAAKDNNKKCKSGN